MQKTGKMPPKVTLWKGFEQKEVIEEYEQQPQKPGPFDLLPHDLVTYIITLLPLKTSLKEAIKNIKGYLIVNKRHAALLYNPAFNGELIEYLRLTFTNSQPQEKKSKSTQESEAKKKADQSDIAIQLGTVGAKSWLKNNIITSSAWRDNKDAIFNITKRLPQPEYQEMVKILIEKSPNFYLTNDKGNTLLIQAIEDDNVDAALFLVRNKVKTEAINNAGKSPVEAAKNRLTQLEAKKASTDILEKWYKLIPELALMEEYSGAQWT